MKYVWQSAEFLIQPSINLFSPSGEQGSVTHGSVVDGKFEGFINTQQGTYYVEPTERYLGDKNVPFHSVIYHEDDIGEYYGIVYNKTPSSSKLARAAIIYLSLDTLFRLSS